MASLIVEILDHLAAVEQWLPPPRDAQEIAAFAESMAAAEDDIMTDEQPDTASAAASSTITATLVDSWRAIAEATIRSQAVATQQPTIDTAARDAAIAAILARKSVEQRTAAWYAQAATILTASEFYTIFRKTRARALLAHAKAKPPTPEELAAKPTLPLTAASEYMSAFDWGIRFEPVVKQIYEHIHGVQIADLGRLVHPTDGRLAASPDGLITTGADPANPLIGRLVEIKCPISREIGGAIPDEYYAQMQLQLEVCGLDVCQYVEARFRSAAAARTAVVEGPGIYSGVLWRVLRVNTEVGGGVERYVYGPVGCPDLEEPPCHLIGQDDVIVERVPWVLLGWHEVEVRRSATWWAGAKRAVDEFWADVEGARAGTFVVPAARVRKGAAAGAAGAAGGEESTMLIKLDEE
jgi:hypothetical protein